MRTHKQKVYRRDGLLPLALSHSARRPLVPQLKLKRTHQRREGTVFNKVQEGLSPVYRRQSGLANLGCSLAYTVTLGQLNAIQSL